MNDPALGVQYEIDSFYFTVKLWLKRTFSLGWDEDPALELGLYVRVDRALHLFIH